MYSQAWLNSKDREARRTRIRLRDYCVRQFVACNGNVDECCKRTTRRNLASEGVGSWLMMLMIGSLLLQMAYTAFKFWREMNFIRPPDVPVPGEPFPQE